MTNATQRIKEKMLELTQLFCVERNIFQRLVIIYKYIRFLNKDPLTRDILQKIFDDTVKTLGEFDSENLDEESFLAVKGEIIFSHDFWVYYANLETIHKKMKKLKKCNIDTKHKFDDLTKLFSKPYSKKMLELSFEIVNSNVFDQLDQECFLETDETDGKTFFDEEKSILYIKGEAVKINIKNKITNAHKILKYIFINNKDKVDDDFFYSEIAEDEFNELDYKNRKNNWRLYHRACLAVNKKIKAQTKNNISDFLSCNTSQQGKVKVDKKYL